MRLIFRFQTLYCFGDLALLCGEQLGDLFYRSIALVIIFARHFAAEHVDAYAALIVCKIQQFYNTDLPGGVDMRRTAGTDVVAGELDEAKPLGDRKLCTIRKRGCLCTLRKPCADRKILCDRFIRKRFHAAQIGIGQNAVYIYGHIGVAKVKSDIVKAKQGVNESGNDMFAAVALHALKAFCKVEYAVHLFSHGKRCMRVMPDFAVCFPGVKHNGIAERADITRLPAPFGEEGGSVEQNRVFFILRFAGKHARIKFLAKGIYII